MQPIRDHYDRAYQDPNYFNYGRWMFSPYVQALISKYHIPRGSSVLDVGCGTGFFSQLFSDVDMNVVGIDLSTTGVRTAHKLHTGRIAFVIGDGIQPPFARGLFDVIYCRGFSPYGRAGLATNLATTRSIVRCLREKGLLLFAISTDLSGMTGGRKRLTGKARSAWINHTLEEIRQHFSNVGSTRLLDLFFINRLEVAFFGQRGLDTRLNHFNAFLSTATGIRGEAICVVEKRAPDEG